MRRQIGFELPVDVVLPVDTVAVALSGSRLYNLANENSDYDLLVVTKSGKSAQVIVDGFDYVTVPYDIFIERIFKSSIVESLIIASGKMLIVDENFRALFEGLNYNDLVLYNKLQEFSLKYLRFLYEGKRLHRAEKSFKTVARNAVMAEKLLLEGLDFNACFSEVERIQVFYVMDKIIEMFKNGESLDAVSEFLGIRSELNGFE